MSDSQGKFKYLFFKLLFIIYVFNAYICLSEYYLSQI